MNGRNSKRYRQEMGMIGEKVEQKKDGDTSHKLAILFFIIAIVTAGYAVHQKNIIKQQENYIDRMKTTITALSQMNNDLGGNVKNVTGKKFK